MNARLTQLLTIDVGHLFKMDLSKWIIVPFLMVFSVVIKVSVNITVVEMQMLSYIVLALSLLSFVVVSVFYFRARTVSRYVAVVILFQLLMFFQHNPIPHMIMS